MDLSRRYGGRDHEKGDTERLHRPSITSGGALGVGTLGVRESALPLTPPPYHSHVRFRRASNLNILHNIDMGNVQRSFASPIGPLRAVSDGEALIGLYMPDHRREPAPVTDGDDAVLRETERQLAAYFSGESQGFDLPLRPKGTPFQVRVWEELRKIPHGESISYAELARRVGQPSAVRAVASANARNPVSIVVPCHRVIGANGKLTGYAGGLDAKRFLLELEREPLALLEKRGTGQASLPMDSQPTGESR